MRPPYSTGTGFYIHDYNIIVTNEHVIRDNKEVVINGLDIKKQLTRVIYIDHKFDLAILEVPADLSIPKANLGIDFNLVEGDSVLAIGHPFGLEYSATRGIVSSTIHKKDDIHYIQHDAALNPGNSGGPLVNNLGDIIGVNTFIFRDGNNIGFSLPINYLKESIDAFMSLNVFEAVRCPSCVNIVGQKQMEGNYCAFCGTKVLLPSRVEDYEPVGISATLEHMLSELDYDVAISRRGPNHWEVQKGSATINISYYEKNGLIIGDAYLCKIPQEEIKKLYKFLLQQNYSLKGLGFSVKENDIILSLLIYDQYLNTKTALHLFNYLFEKADELDDILVDRFGAKWRELQL